MAEHPTQCIQGDVSAFAGSLVVKDVELGDLCSDHEVKRIVRHLNFRL